MVYFLSSKSPKIAQNRGIFGVSLLKIAQNTGFLKNKSESRKCIFLMGVTDCTSSRTSTECLFCVFPVWPERVGKRGSWERGARRSLCGRA